MKLIVDNKGGTKRLRARYLDDDGKVIKTTSFGAKTSLGTFADGARAEKRKNYITRHKALGEDWTRKGKFTAGFLSRWVLWEAKTNEEIRKILSKKTGIPLANVKVTFPRYPIRRTFG